MQKKVTSTRHSKLPRVHQIFTFSDPDDSSANSTELCSPCNSEVPTPASSEDAGVFLFNNVPGLPPRSPTAIPMLNLELAQVQHHDSFSDSTAHANENAETTEISTTVQQKNATLKNAETESQRMMIEAKDQESAVFLRWLKRRELCTA